MALYYCLKKCFVGGTLCFVSVKENGFQQYRFPDGFDFAGLMPLGEDRYYYEEAEGEEEYRETEAYEEGGVQKTRVVIKTRPGKIKVKKIYPEFLDADGNEFDYEPCFQLVDEPMKRTALPQAQKSDIRRPTPPPMIANKKVVQAGRGPGGMLAEGEELNPVGPIEFEFPELPNEAVSVSESGVGVPVPTSLAPEIVNTEGANNGPRDPEGPGGKKRGRPAGAVPRRTPASRTPETEVRNVHNQDELD